VCGQAKDEVAVLLGMPLESGNVTTPSTVTPHTDKDAHPTVTGQPERVEVHPAEAVLVVCRFPKARDP